MPDVRPDKRFFFVRSKDTGEVSVAICWTDGTENLRGQPRARVLWDVLLPGWHDWETQGEFDEWCEVISEIPAPTSASKE